MHHVPVIRGLNLQGKTCAEALGNWVCRGFYFVLKWGFQNKIIFVNVLERLSNKRAKKSTCPRDISPKLVLYMRDQGLEPWIPWLRGGQNCNDYTIDKRRHRKYNSYVVTPNLATESGCWILDFLVSFILSVMASVVAYYLCKWLDGKDRDD